jgi:hypothetical protein
MRLAVIGAGSTYTAEVIDGLDGADVLRERRRDADGQDDRREPSLPRMGLIVGVGAGNSKAELLLATLEGEPSAYVRGPGSNAHGLGADGVVAALGKLVERSGLDAPAEHGAFFLCGVDIPSDIVELCTTSV